MWPDTFTHVPNPCAVPVHGGVMAQHGLCPPSKCRAGTDECWPVTAFGHTFFSASLSRGFIKSSLMPAGFVVKQGNIARHLRQTI